MDRATLAERLVRAREAAGMTQDGLARAAGVDDGAVSSLEAGTRAVDVRELSAVAGVLGQPLSALVAEPVPAVVSRRRDTVSAHPTTRPLDIELESFATDVRLLVQMGLIEPVGRLDGVRLPRDQEDAERISLNVRRRLGLGAGSVPELAEDCARLGLFTYSVALGQAGPDGACVEVDARERAVGACVVNGDAPPGRRRMTLAHELGHWLSGDAYDAEASADAEQMINSFAVHFLAPRAGVRSVWSDYSQRPVRDRVLAVAAVFRLSWSAALWHLRTLELLDADQFRTLQEPPRPGDFLRLGLSFTTELDAPYLSTEFAAAVVNAYVARRLTEARTVELLRGTLNVADLPDRDSLTFDDVRRSFAGHDG